jgi:hypothetical protein
MQRPVWGGLASSLVPGCGASRLRWAAVRLRERQRRPAQLQPSGLPGRWCSPSASSASARSCHTSSDATGAGAGAASRVKFDKHDVVIIHRGHYSRTLCVHRCWRLHTAQEICGEKHCAEIGREHLHCSGAWYVQQSNFWG